MDGWMPGKWAQWQTVPVQPSLRPHAGYNYTISEFAAERDDYLFSMKGMILVW